MEPHLRISVCLALMWSSLLMFFLACLGSVGFVASATSKLPPEQLKALTQFRRQHRRSHWSRTAREVCCAQKCLASQAHI